MYKKSLLVFILLLGVSRAADAATWLVGPTRGTTGLERQTPCAALTAVANGDTIQIDGADGSGNQIEYIDDTCQLTATNLTIEGVGSKRPHVRWIKAKLTFDQAGWYLFLSWGTTSLYVVRNIEFSGAHNEGGNNGQPVLFGNTSFVLDNVYIHHNNDGILTGDEGHHLGADAVTGPNRLYTVEIYNSEIAYNGARNPAGNSNGNSHNIYVGRRLSLLIQGSYIHDSRSGQGIKSRAQTNWILYNRIVDNVPGVLVPPPSKSPVLVDAGASNYELDFSLGGNVYLIGNIIYQSSGTKNETIVLYCGELEWSDLANTVFNLSVSNNTFINASAGASVIALRTFRTPLASQGQDIPITTLIKNNIFAGFGGTAKILYDDPTTTTTTPADNIITTTITAANFRDALTQNYHLTGSSPALDAGGFDAGSVNGFSMAPVNQYTHERSVATRTSAGTRDAGAYEFDGPEGTGFTAPILFATESSTGVTLLWTAGISDATITQYRVFKNGSLLSTVTGVLTTSDNAGAAGVSATYYVIADRSGGTAQSNTVTAGKVRQVTGTLDAATGWQEVTGTTLDSVCSPATQCALEYWRNAVTVDTTHNRLLWGNTGTSLEHPGNEIYALNIGALTVSRLNTTDTVLANGANALANGRPNARHRARLAWAPGTGLLYQQGGYIPGGTFTLATWAWTPGTDTWVAPSLTGAPNDSTGMAVWDGTSKIVNVSWTCIDLYDPATGTYTQPVACSPRPPGPYSGLLNATRDPVRNRMYTFGPLTAGYYDATNSYAYVEVTSPTCGVFQSILPGVSWDAASGKIVGWNGGNTVHLLDPATNTCTSQSFGGGPGYPFNYEALGKFQCVASAGGCFAATESSKNWFFVRLSASVSGHTGGSLRIGGKVGDTP